MRLRFAPSPTGQLHVGNARTALFNWLLARGNDGTLILRIEDTDAERSTKESEDSILLDLRWLGLEWDEGPDVGGASGPYRQSERLHLYTSYANELLSGGHAYYCFCAPQKLEDDRRKDLAAGRPPKYHGTCRNLPPEEARRRLEAGERAVVRFRVPEHIDVAFQDMVRGEVTFSTDVIGDPVLVRSDGRPAYNFAVVVDDALMEVTHVIRGEDHISNTPRQILLYRALGFGPPRFAHLSLVLGPDHTPLSKRHGATSVSEFRARGFLPEALTNYLALIGWSPRSGGEEPQDAELMPLDEMARRFAIENVGHSAGVFDPEKLAWMNRHYMKVAAPARIAAESARYFQARGFLKRRSDAGLAYVESLLPMAVGSVDRLEEIPDRLAFLFQYDAAQALSNGTVAGVLHEPGAREVIAALGAAIDGPLLDRDAFRAMANRVKEKTGQKGKALFHPIRVALTGESGGPELDLAVPAMDRGAALPPDAGVAKIFSARERAKTFAAAVGELRRAGMLVYGINPVVEALRAGKVRRLRISARSDKRMDEILALAAKRGISVERADAQALDRAAKGGVHQGVVAEIEDARDYSVQELAEGGRPLIVVLDGIEDPHNVGAILRTCDAAGVTGVIRQERHSASLDGVVGKASAGALAHARIATVVNIARAVEELKDANVWTIGLAGDAGDRHTDVDWTLPSAIVLGAEGTGLRRLVRERCDRLVRIPMRGHVESLNVSVAAGVVLFEVLRQRGESA